MVGPSEIYVLAGALASPSRQPTLRRLADELCVDHTFVYRALGRAQASGLYDAARKRVNRPNFEELVSHSARFIAPAPLGALTPGVRAAWAAPPVSKHIREAGGEPPPVWPVPSGKIRGQALEPLHPSAVAAGARNPQLAQLLAIIDSLRAGDVRVREVAARELHRTLTRMG